MATYFVSQDGSGDGDGTDYVDKASVAYHNAGTGVFADLAGDTVYLCGDITSSVIPPSSGGEGSYCTYKGDYTEAAGAIDTGDAAAAIAVTSKDYLDFQNIVLSGSKYGLRGTGSTGLKMSGITVSGMSVFGIELVTSPSAVIQNLDISAVYSSGIFLNDGCDGSEISSCYIHDPATVTGGDRNAIGVYQSSNVKLYQNTLCDFLNALIAIAGTQDDSGIEIYKNIIRDGQSNGIKIDNANSVDIYHNLISNCTTRNIYVNTVTAYKQVVNIYNNVCYGAKEATAGNVQVYDDLDVHADTAITIKNNIVSHSTGRHMMIRTAVLAKCTLDYNLYYPEKALGWTGAANYSTFAAWKTATSQDTNSLCADPVFTDPTGNDFSLIAPSPCIRSGADVGLTEDIIGTSIPQRGTPDIGAYEFVRAVPPATAARWQAMLRALKYKNTTSEPTAGDRTLAIHATTLTGKTSNEIAGTITVTE